MDVGKVQVALESLGTFMDETSNDVLQVNSIKYVDVPKGSTDFVPNGLRTRLRFESVVLPLAVAASNRIHTLCPMRCIRANEEKEAMK